MSQKSKRKHFEKKKKRKSEFVKVKNERDAKHIVSPLIYDLTTKLGSEHSTLNTVSKMINNLDKIKKYSMDINNKLYGEVAYDNNFAPCSLNGNEMFNEDILKHIFRKNGVYIKNNIMNVFSMIPYDTHKETYNVENVSEKIILPLLSPLNDRLIGALSFEGKDIYVKDAEGDVEGLLTFLATVSRIIAISNEYESDELVRGVKNKRSVQKRLNFALNSKLDRDEELWFFMIDIDFFKKVNDSYGHDVGDVVLQNVGKVILDNVKSYTVDKENDEVFRCGGEEFCIIFKGNKEAAIKAGERIKWYMAEKVMYNYGEKEVKVTCSIGIAEGTQLVKKYLNENQSKEDALKNGINELIKKADDALYEAKRNGRNLLVVKD